MPGSNAATRVHRILQHASTVDGTLPALEGMFELFHLGGLPSTINAGRQAAQRMNLLLDQLDRIEHGLRQIGVPDRLWHEALEHARTGFSPLLLSGSWQQVLEHFDRDVDCMLQWSTFVLPPDDGEIPPEQTGQLLLDIEEVLMLAEQIELPELLHEFIGGHMHALLEGLRVSVIAGMQPLRDAIKTVAGDLALRKDSLGGAISALPPDTASVCERASAVIRRAMDMTNQASEAGSGNQKLGAALGSALNLLQH